MDEQPIVGEEQAERPKPRVVDKRSRGASSSPPAPAPESAPAAEQPPPQNEPPAEASGEGGFIGAGSQPLIGGAPQEHVWTPEQEAEARAVMEQIVRTPGIEWVVNSAVSLANIAATKIESGYPGDARLVIDALAGILDKVGADLGNVEQPLRQTLAQLQMAYAQTVSQPPPAQP